MVCLCFYITYIVDDALSRRLYVFAIDTFQHSYFNYFPSRSSDLVAQLPRLQEWFLSFICHGNCKSEIGFGCFLSDKHDQGFIMTSSLMYCNSKGRWDECPSRSFDVSL